MSHMIADTLKELHIMAATLGLKRSWFQDTSTPHYDICQAKKQEAISMGVIEVSPRELIHLARK